MSADDPAVAYELAEARELLGLALARLTFRERRLLAYRFGLFGEIEYTLEECGRIFNITRERVRQIVLRALRRLARGPHADVLRQSAHLYSQHITQQQRQLYEQWRTANLGDLPHHALPPATRGPNHTDWIRWADCVWRYEAGTPPADIGRQVGISASNAAYYAYGKQNREST